MVTTLDRYGRLIIPKKLREHLGITKDTNLNIHEEGKRIIIEPVQSKDVLVVKEGILVYTGNISGEADKLLKTDRKNQDQKLNKEKKS